MFTWYVGISRSPETDRQVSLITGKCQGINQERIQQGEVGGGCGAGGSAARLQPFKIEIKETQILWTRMISNVHGLSFSLDQSLKSADH